LGLALHFLIAITTAAVYYLVALRWPLLWGQPLLSGTIYGLLVYGWIFCGQVILDRLCAELRKDTCN
jgi:hypothetical protein